MVWGSASASSFLIIFHRHDLELVGKDVSALPKLPARADGAVTGFGGGGGFGFGAPAAVAEPTFGAVKAKVTDPEKMLEAFEDGNDDEELNFVESDDDAASEDEADESEQSASKAPKLSTKTRYQNLPLVQFATALASYLVSEMLNSIDAARNTQDIAGINAIREILAVFGTEITVFSFRASLLSRASAWFSINSAAAADQNDLAKFFKSIGSARACIRLESHMTDVLQLKPALRAKLLALAEQNVSSLAQLSLSMGDNGIESLLRKYVALRSAPPSALFAVEPSRTRQLCRLFSSSRSLRSEDLNQLQSSWTQIVTDTVFACLAQSASDHAFVILFITPRFPFHDCYLQGVLTGIPEPGGVFDDCYNRGALSR